VDAGAGDKVDTWVVYPERPDRAPVVLVVHEIYGLTDWVRAVADQLGAEGFIAVAPDLLSGKAPGGGGSGTVDRDAAVNLVSGLEWGEVVRRLNAVARYATGLPSAAPQYAVVGFCWGGGVSFGYATEQPGLAAAVLFYGTSPAVAALSKIRAPILGLYGGNDNRVDATIPPAEAEMKRLAKRFEKEIYEGAGHAFMRLQDGQNGANLKAAQAAWPRMLRFLKQAFGEPVSMSGSVWLPAAGFSAIDSCPCGGEPDPKLVALLSEGRVD
jgi:carboxymethylenebutenolidase